MSACRTSGSNAADPSPVEREPERATQPTRGVFTLWRSATLLAAGCGGGARIIYVAVVAQPESSDCFVGDSGGFCGGGREHPRRMVYVDDKSGWLVVWAADTAEKPAA